MEDEAIRAAMEEMKERTAEERVSLLTTQSELVTASPNVVESAIQLREPTYRDRHGNRHVGDEAVRKAKQEDADYNAAVQTKVYEERRKFEEFVELIQRRNEEKNAHEWRGMFAEDWPPLYMYTLPPQWLERSINTKKSFTIYGLYTNISRQLDSPEKGALFFMGMCDALGNKIAEFGQFLADITYAINQATMHGDFEPLRELIEAFCSSLWDLITQILTGAFLPEILDGIIDALYRIESAKGPRELGEAVGDYLLFVLETIGPNNIIKTFSKVIKGTNMAGKTAKVVDGGKTPAKPAAKKPDSRETKGTATKGKFSIFENDVLQHLSKQDRKSVQSLRDQAEKHRQKLSDYKKNPDLYDNKGFLKHAGADLELRVKIINSRIEGLTKEIRKFENEIEKVLEKYQ